MLTIQIDPTAHWGKNNIKHELIYNKCIPIISWVLNPDFEDKSLLDTISKQYQFGWHSFEGFSINHDGTMTYPGDPDTIPLIYIEREYGTTMDYLWFYQHDWITICDRETRKFITARVD